MENPVYKMFIAAFIHYNQKCKTTHMSFSLWTVNKRWPPIQRTTTQQQGGLTTARYKLDGPQAHGAEGSPTRKDSGDGLLVKAETQGLKTHQWSPGRAAEGDLTTKGKRKSLGWWISSIFWSQLYEFLKTHRIIHLQGSILLPANYI